MKSIFFHVGRTERSMSDSFYVMSDMLRSVRPTFKSIRWPAVWKFLLFFFCMSLGTFTSEQENDEDAGASTQ